MTKFVYTLWSRCARHESPSTYGCWDRKEYAIASAYNIAPSTAKILYSEKKGHELELRPSVYNDDEVYTVYQVEVYSIPLSIETFHISADYDDDNDETPWPDADEDEEEPDYSQWYDRNPGDPEMPDNYPEAVAPEDFAPTDYDDDDLAIGWLESAIDEVNYEQDHL